MIQGGVSAELERFVVVGSEFPVDSLSLSLIFYTGDFCCWSDAVLLTTECCLSQEWSSP